MRPLLTLRVTVQLPITRSVGKGSSLEALSRILS